MTSLTLTTLPLDNLIMSPPQTSGATRMAYLNVEGSLERGLSWELPYLKVIWQPSLPEGSSSKRLSLCLEASGEVEHFY